MCCIARPLKTYSKSPYRQSLVREDHIIKCLSLSLFGDLRLDLIDHVALMCLGVLFFKSLNFTVDMLARRFDLNLFDNTRERVRDLSDLPYNCT